MEQILEHILFPTIAKQNISKEIKDFIRYKFQLEDSIYDGFFNNIYFYFDRNFNLPFYNGLSYALLNSQDEMPQGVG